MNRRQRRKLEKQYAKNIVDLLNASDRLSKVGVGHSLPKGTEVKLNPMTITRGNMKREDWVEKHLQDVFTIGYDEKWGKEPFIYILEEDDSDPKWYFTQKELIVLHRKERT